MENEIGFRIADPTDVHEIMDIIDFAIEQRRLDGSRQWQDGYPNLNSIQHDIESEYGYVLEEAGEILFYAAVIFGIEPAYEKIEGKWLNREAYCVIHRMAAAPKAKGKGLAKIMMLEIEKLCLSRNIHNIKIDTNFDNPAMLKLIDNLGYIYCGEVYFRGSSRKAYHKVLK